MMVRTRAIVVVIGSVLISGCGLQREATNPTPPVIVASSTSTVTATSVVKPTDTVVVPTATATLAATIAPALPTNTPIAIAPPAITAVVPTAATTGFNGQVSDGRGGLRLRAAPNSAGTILDSLDELTALNVTGRSADNVWLRVVTPQNQSGWVMSQYVTLNVVITSLPVLDASGNSLAAVNTVATPLPDLASAHAYVVAEGQGLRLRSLPSTNSEVLATLPEQAPVQIIGRTLDKTWVQVKIDNGTEGWVWAQYLHLNIGLDGVGIPDVALLPTPTAAGGNYSGISNVTSNAVQIFLRGQSLGNRANVFAKVGDSITATYPFLYPIGWGDYNLRSYSHLQGVASYFRSATAIDANSFASVSMAARGGWQTLTVLNPDEADVPPCQGGEMPLVCEYRLARPSVALIMLGSNDQWTEPAIFQANLQRIVEISIEMGVIPALSTIPPTNLNWSDKVPVINQIITATALQYDVPIWDFHGAMVSLPNQGLSADGVHPSTPPAGDRAAADFTTENLQYGYTVRNVIALQMLDAVWRQVIAPNEGITPPAAAAVDLPSVPPSQGACPDLPARLAVGVSGRVTPGEANNLRAEPSLGASKIGSIPPGGVFAVLGGPVCSDGMTYWQVSYNSLTGWTPEGRAGSYWVEPAN